MSLCLFNGKLSGKGMQRKLHQNKGERVMKKRNWLKTTIAMITLVATVLETGFTSVSTLAAEITTEDGIVVNNDAVEDAESDGYSDDTDIDVSTDYSDDEDLDVASVTDAEEDADLAEEESFEEADELKSGSLDVDSSGISGSGYDEISVYVNTERLAKKDIFRIKFEGPSSASYNPIINDDLDKTNGGRYDFDNLEGGDFYIDAVSSENVILSYRYNEDGYPEIVLESEEPEKVLETRNLTSKSGKEISAISGEGFESIKVRFNTDELSDKASFKLIVETDAQAKVDGKDATVGIEGLDKDTAPLTVDDLDGESFVAYVISDDDEIEIATIADVDSVEDGEVTFTVDNVDTKRVYEYEDAKIKVTATLEKADAIPDDAYFDVTPLTDEEAEAYLTAANANLEEGQMPYTEDNSLLYNIGFYTDESKKEEIEPEEGSVRLFVEFKRDQLADEIGSTEEDGVEVVHFEEEGRNITPVVVDSDVSVDEGTANFELDTFSVILFKAVSQVSPGTARSLDGILGNAIYYGITANTLELGGHMDTNMAVGKLKASCNTTQGAYTGSGNPGNDIIAAYEGSGWYADVSSQKVYRIETTTDVYNALTNYGTNTNYTSRPYITFDTNHTELELSKKVAGYVSGTASAALAAEQNVYNFRSAATHATPGNDSTAWKLDISTRPAGTYYFTFNNNDNTDYYSKFTNNGGPMQIKMRRDQYIVFNIPDEKVKLEQFEIDLGDGMKTSAMQDKNADEYCQHIVWNLYNAKETGNGGSILGIVLAPQGHFEVGGTSTGWLVANKVTNGGEWHMVWQDMPETEGVSTQFFAKKFVNDQVPTGDEVFTFDLYSYDWNTKTYSAQPIQSVTNTGEDIEFKRINYDYDTVKNAGGDVTYAYKVVEREFTKAGYQRDTNEYVIHVKVRVNGSKLEIYETNVYGKGGKPYINNDYSKAGTKIRFNNPHIVKEDDDNTSYTIKVKKTLKDKKTGKVLKNNWPTTFKFTIKPEYTDVITPVDPHQTVPSPNPKTVTISNGTDNVQELLTLNFNAKEVFEHMEKEHKNWTWNYSINRNLAGGGTEEVWATNYKYSITETKVDNDGIEYGQPLVQYIKLWVNVSKITKNGHVTYKFITDQDTTSKSFGMKVLPRYSINNENCASWDTNPLEFVNQYEAEGSTKIYGLKVLDNTKLKKGDFTFVLKDSTGKTLETVTNEANGEINFKHEFKYTLDDLNDEKSKAFRYTIEEDTSKSKVKNASPISDNPISFTITVTNNGTQDPKTHKRILDIDNPYSSKLTPFKFINKVTTNGDVEFYVKKINTSNDPELADKKFSFKLIGKGADSNISQQIDNIGVNDLGHFDKIDYKQVNSAATHEYQIYEINDGQGGVVYDGRKYDIKVIVSVDENTGAFKKEIWAGYDGDLKQITGNVLVTAEFDNGYDLKSTEDDIDGNKTLHGKDLEDDEFTFKLEAFDDVTKEAVAPTDPEKTAVVIMPSQTEVKNKANGSFKFDKITFMKAGTYTFKVSEIPGEDSRYTYDGTYYTVTIPVKDVNGQLTVDTANKVTKDNKGNVVSAVSFDNSFNGEGSITLYARKNFSGRGLKDGEFTFTIEGEGVSQTVTNNGSTVAFGPIEYTTGMMKDAQGNELKTKEFKYIIKEFVPDEAKKPENIKDGFYTLNGVYYDKQAEEDHEVTVTVTRNADGSLTAVADKCASVSADATEVEFDNFYKAVGSFSFDGSKIIMGRKFVKDDKFTITLTGPEGSGINSSVFVDTTEGNTLGTWSFGDYQVNQDNYNNFKGVYTVVEEQGGGAKVAGKDVTNDRTIYHALVTLTDDEKGNIHDNVVYYKDNPESPITSIVFKNTYDAEGTVNLQAIKELKKGTLEPHKFQFYLKDENNNVIDEKWNGEGANGETISADLAIFKNIDYTLDQLGEPNADGTYNPRTFTYTIGEYEGDEEFVTYNVGKEENNFEKDLYTVEVTVSDNGSGILHAEKIYKDVKGVIVDEDEAKFINEYHTNGDVEIYARKILNGRTLKDDDFTFILKDESGVERTAKVKVSNDNKAVFDKILFDEDDLNPLSPKFALNHATDEAGKYARYYTLREEIPEGAVKYTAEENGKTRVFYKKDGYVYDGTIYSVVVTLKDNKAGHIDTGWVAYPEGDVLPDSLAWYEKLWDTVKEWFGGDASGHKAVFTNTYESTGALQLKAKKSLVGKENKAGDFSFILSGKDESGKDFSYKVATGEDFISVFPQIKYTKEGDYTYTIEEFVPEGAEKDKVTGLMVKDGVKYDNHKYKVEVSVKEKDQNTGNGKLVVSIKVDEAAAALTESTATIDGKEVDLYTAEPVLFTNTYDAIPVEVNLGGWKVLTGRDLEEGDVFSFKIEGAEGTSLPAGYNGTVTVHYTSGNKGAFTFPTITYTLADMEIEGQKGVYEDYKEFKYTVTEVVPPENERIEGITYNPTNSVYNVVVGVTNANGKLSAKIKSNDLEKDPDDIATFTNNYNAEGDLTINVLKMVYTPEPEHKKVAATDKDFDFELTGDGITTPLTATAVNGGVGTFKSLSYELADLGPKNSEGKYEKKFTYYVNEIAPQDKEADPEHNGGYKYTDDYYEIVVTVKSNGKTDGGKLDISKEVTKKNHSDASVSVACGDIETVEFDNEYYAFGHEEIEGEKKISGNIPADNVFYFSLFDEDDNVVSGPVSTVNGGFKFEFDYTQKDIGTYNYKVKEVLLDGQEADPDIDYDDSIYDVTITVADKQPGDKDGTLRVSKVITKDNTTKTFDKCYFNNTEYKPNSIVFTAIKTLEGKALEDDMFTFTLTGDGQDQKVHNNGEAVTFDAIEYKLSDFNKGETEKTYNYTVKEERTCTKPGGISYVKTDYTATVKVSLVNGKIVIDPKIQYQGDDITMTVKDGENGAKVVSGIEFVNKYEDSVEVLLGAFKHLNGFSDETPLGTYKFELKDKDANKVIQSMEVTPDNAKDDKYFDFEPIKYTQDDLKNEKGEYLTQVTRNYSLKEVVPTIEEGRDSNVTYATNEYDVTVTLSYDKDGNIVAKVSADGLAATVKGKDKNGKDIVYLGNMGFTNTYAAEGSVILEGLKTITGKELENAAYTFTLTGEGQDQEVKNAGNAFTFKPISYTQKDLGVHTYEIKETASVDGSVIGTDYFVAKVTVAPGQNGKLAVSKVYTRVDKDGKELKVLGEGESMTFDNTFEAVGEVPVGGVKRMYNKPLKGNEFTFVIKDENGNILKDADGNEYKVTNKAADLEKLDGKKLAEVAFDFAPIKFNQEDLKNPADGSYLNEITKYYTVEELVEGVSRNSKGELVKDGVKYSEAIYAVEVNVKLNKAEQKLDVTKDVRVIKDNDGNSVGKMQSATGIRGLLENLFKENEPDKDIEKDKDGLILIMFKNVYRAECPIDPPMLHKEIMGRTIKPGEFKFNINGPGLPSMQEEKTGYVRTVKNGLVADENGVEHTYYIDRTGERHDLPAGEVYVGDVHYQINEDYDDLDLGNVEDFEVVGDKFGDGFSYSKYVYHAEEVVPKKGDKDYDETVEYSGAKLELTVYVADNEKGKLIVRNQDGGIVEFNEKGEMISDAKLYWFQKSNDKISPDQIKELDGKKIDIVNIYTQKGYKDLVGLKALKGRKLTKDDIFEFTITEVDEFDKPLAGRTATVNNETAKNTQGKPSVVAFRHDGDNAIPFLNYRYGAFPKDGSTDQYEWVDDTGRHFYYIEETSTDGNGIKCDTAKFKVTIDVAKSDNDKDGELKVKVHEILKIYSDNNTEIFEYADGNSFKFENEFKANGSVDINGIKLLEDLQGNTLASPDALLNQFGFALYKYDDAARTTGKTLVDMKRTAADGSFKFDTIKYDQQILWNEKKSDYDDSTTLYYQLEEIKPSIGVWTENNTVFESDGVVYDLSKYNIDVEVKFDGTNTLKVGKKVTDAATGVEVAPYKGADVTYDASFLNKVKEYTTIEGNKYWIDNFKDPTKRPDVVVELYSITASGVKTKINEYTIVAPDTTYRFDTDDKGNRLPTCDSAGRPITYDVEETPIENYLSEKINYDFYNTQGDILIRKIDSVTGSPLSGAVLAILDGTTEIERWTSGASAHVVDSVLTPGKTYTLHEVSAPEGYDVVADMTFTVPTDGKSITVTMADPPIVGSVRLVKRDASTRETLAGAEFALYTEAGARIYGTGSAGSYRATTTTSNGVFVTDASGALTVTDLPYGTYYFVETKAPEGYALSSERVGFTILRSSELVEVSFLDPKAAAAVRIRKVGGTGRTLAGAVFELYSSTPRTLGQAASSTLFSDAYYRYGTYRTNSEGLIYVDDLPWGDYYFVEVDAPEGYEVATDVNGDDLVYTFTIAADSAGRTIDLGDVVNTPPEEGVLGARVKKGGVVNGVLGVRAKPVSGVLGERIGPVTGDASNIILWLLLLTACVATIVATIVTGKKKKTAK